MNRQSENTELVDLINHSQATQNAVANRCRKNRSTKTHSRGKRGHINRKRSREGQLVDTRNDEEPNSAESAETSEPTSSNNGIEIIDVELVKDKPVVDLTHESRNEVYVDLTCSPDQSHHRQSVIRYQSLVGRAKAPEQNKSTDDVVIVPKETEGVDNVLSDITCAICMDDFNQIKKAKRQLTSTTCGHVFCDPCITSSIRSQSKCPTCRKRLTKRSLHPIFL
ncbi:E3 ubiquitin-protein ligase RNF4-like [Dendronephthya gigantea]|uniref:E3 ubiquitin-protein ligase RNF4-like n=1 Tax=Dendronephthya gigantea TaxID=151771 RepID=UPI00106CFB6E|nr:E3 ubiquitin-protein ligase RNF4-like [Dendronephthya gigantea]